MEVNPELGGSESGRINPYAPPERFDVSEPLGASQGESLSPADQRCLRVGQAVVTWEKLRILYNAILGVEAVVIFVWAIYLGESIISLVKLFVVGGLFANLFFFIGPAVDGYLSWLGLRSPKITWLLFILGTGFSILLGIVFMASLATFGMIDD